MASEVLPLPLTPVKATIFPLGIRTEMLRRLWVRAPMISIQPESFVTPVPPVDHRSRAPADHSSGASSGPTTGPTGPSSVGNLSTEQDCDRDLLHPDRARFSPP